MAGLDPQNENFKHGREVLNSLLHLKHNEKRGRIADEYKKFVEDNMGKKDKEQEMNKSSKQNHFFFANEQDDDNFIIE